MPYELRIQFHQSIGRIFLKNSFPLQQIFDITWHLFEECLPTQNSSGVRLAASCAEDLSGIERGVAVAAPPPLRGGPRFSSAEPPSQEDREFKKGDDGREEYHVKHGPAVGCDDRRHNVRSEPDVDSVLREERCLDDAEPYDEVDKDGNRKRDSAEEDGEEDNEVEVCDVYGETGTGGDEELGEGDYEELRQDKVAKGEAHEKQDCGGDYEGVDQLPLVRLERRVDEAVSLVCYYGHVERDC